MTNVGQKIVERETVKEKEHREWLAQVKPGELVAMSLNIPNAFLEPTTRLAVPVMVLVNPFNENFSHDLSKVASPWDNILKEAGKAITLLLRKQVIVLIDEKPTTINISWIGPLK